MKSSKPIEFSGVYNPIEQAMEVSPQTFRSALGESEYQLRLAEKTNAINDARSDLSAAVNDPSVDSEEIEWLQTRFAKAMDAAGIWLITLDDILAAMNSTIVSLKVEVVG